MEIRTENKSRYTEETLLTNSEQNKINIITFDWYQYWTDTILDWYIVGCRGVSQLGGSFLGSPPDYYRKQLVTQEELL